MRCRLGSAVAGAAVGLATLVAGAQDQAPSVFRGRVTEVSVDVYPRRDGHIVEGLTSADFQILEDGQPQAIETFEFVRIPPDAADADRRDPNTQEEGDRLAADPHHRVFVIYLDIYHTTRFGALNSRAPLIEFVHRAIAPDDLLAVMTPEVPVEQIVFGRSTFTLEKELRDSPDWGLQDQPITPLGRPPVEAMLESCATSPGSGDALLALYREDALASSLEALMIRLRDLRDERKNVLLVSEGWIPKGPSNLAAMASGTIPSIGVRPGGSLGLDGPRDRVGSGRSWCDEQIRRLSSIDFVQRFRDLLGRANRANVSFYTVDVGGLRPLAGYDARRRSGPLPRPAGLLSDPQQGRQTTLQVLAENTDGRAVYNTNDPEIGLRRIADDLSAYYLLGYRSTNTALDGKYRRIEVRVKASKVSVTARRGYLAAVEAPAAATSAQPAVAADVTDALGRLARLRSGADLYSVAVRRPDSLEIIVEIGGEGRAGAAWRGGATIEGRIIGAGGASYRGSGRIDPGAQSARLSVPVPAAEHGPLRVNLTASGASEELTDHVDVDVAAGDALVGAPILFRGGTGARATLQPAAQFQFTRSERLRVEWPAPAALDERVARVLDRRGEPLALAASVTETDAPRGHVVDVDLNLAPLAEGDYVIELTAGRAGQSQRQLVAFRVVR